MARGTPMRPASGAGRSQPARRAQPKVKQQPRGGSTQRQAQQRQVDQQRRAEQQRREEQKRRAEQQRQLQLQRQAAQRRAAAKADQHRLRQQMYLREARAGRRESAAEAMTEEVRQRVADLSAILTEGLRHDPRIDLQALRLEPEQPPFDAGPLAEPAPEPQWSDFAPGPLTSRLTTAAGRQRREEAAREEYERARQQWQEAEQERKERLAAAERAHADLLTANRQRVEQYHDRVARVAAGLRERESAAVESFLRTVLRRTPLPPGFPRRASVVHHREQEQAEVRLVLPDRTVVPEVSGYEYVARADEIRPVPRPESECADLYRQVLAQVALLVVRDLLAAEVGLEGVTLHGLVAEGEPPQPVSLLRLDASREAFETLDLEGEPAEELLQRLGGHLSSNPYAHQPLVLAGGPA